MKEIAANNGLEILPSGEQYGTILSNSKLIDKVSKERIGAELTQIFSYDCEERLVLGDLLDNIFDCWYGWYDHYSVLSQFYFCISLTASKKDPN